MKIFRKIKEYTKNLPALPGGREQAGGNKKGALLLELLIVISLLAVILSFGTNAVLLSLKSNKVSGDRDIANSLATESLEAVRAIVEENWQNIYALTKTTQHYYTTQSGGKWVLASGDESINVAGLIFTRYVVIDNVSRDATTRLVQNSYSSSTDDPSTQKVSVIVSWPAGDPVVIYEYFFRWKNKVCAQTAWTTGQSGTTVQDCPNATFDTKDDVIDISGGSLKLQ